MKGIFASLLVLVTISHFPSPVLSGKSHRFSDNKEHVIAKRDTYHGSDGESPYPDGYPGSYPGGYPGGYPPYGGYPPPYGGYGGGYGGGSSYPSVYCNCPDCGSSSGGSSSSQSSGTSSSGPSSTGTQSNPGTMDVLSLAKLSGIQSNAPDMLGLQAGQSNVLSSPKQSKLNTQLLPNTLGGSSSGTSSTGSGLASSSTSNNAGVLGNLLSLNKRK